MGTFKVYNTSELSIGSLSVDTLNANNLLQHLWPMYITVDFYLTKDSNNNPTTLYSHQVIRYGGTYNIIPNPSHPTLSEQLFFQQWSIGLTQPLYENTIVMAIWETQLNITIISADDEGNENHLSPNNYPSEWNQYTTNPFEPLNNIVLSVNTPPQIPYYHFIEYSDNRISSDNIHLTTKSSLTAYYYTNRIIVEYKKLSFTTSDEPPYIPDISARLKNDDGNAILYYKYDNYDWTLTPPSVDYNNQIKNFDLKAEYTNYFTYIKNNITLTFQRPQINIVLKYRNSNNEEIEETIQISENTSLINVEDKKFMQGDNNYYQYDYCINESNNEKINKGSLDTYNISSPTTIKAYYSEKYYIIQVFNSNAENKKDVNPIKIYREKYNTQLNIIGDLTNLGIVPTNSDESLKSRYLIGALYKQLENNTEVICQNAEEYNIVTNNNDFRVSWLRYCNITIQLVTSFNSTSIKTINVDYQRFVGNKYFESECSTIITQQLPSRVEFLSVYQPAPTGSEESNISSWLLSSDPYYIQALCKNIDTYFVIDNNSNIIACGDNSSIISRQNTCLLYSGSKSEYEQRINDLSIYENNKPEDYTIVDYGKVTYSTYRVTLSNLSTYLIQ